MLDLPILDSRVDLLAEVILELRRRDPTNVESRLRTLRPDLTDDSFETRRSIRECVDPSAYDLVCLPGAKDVVKSLGSSHRLILLTAGDKEKQALKVRLAGLNQLFEAVRYVSAEQNLTKLEALRDIREEAIALRSPLTVVGNRIDDELAAAFYLSLPAVWLRNGEGSQMRPDLRMLGYAIEIDCISAIPRALGLTL